MRNTGLILIISLMAMIICLIVPVFLFFTVQPSILIAMSFLIEAL
jgi:hypothetical protein